MIGRRCPVSPARRDGDRHQLRSRFTSAYLLHLRHVFWICRHCDRGHCYCSPSCRYQGYRQKQRLANRRHQQSPEGRLDHRDRQRALRRRRSITQKNVTDQSSLSSVASHKMSLAVAFRWPSGSESPSPSFSGWLHCIVCGRRGQFVDP